MPFGHAGGIKTYTLLTRAVSSESGSAMTAGPRYNKKSLYKNFIPKTTPKWKGHSFKMKKPAHSVEEKPVGQGKS